MLRTGIDGDPEYPVAHDTEVQPRLRWQLLLHPVGPEAWICLSRDEKAKAWALGLSYNDYEPEVREVFAQAKAAKIDTDAQRGLDFVR